MRISERHTLAAIAIVVATACAIRNTPEDHSALLTGEPFIGVSGADYLGVIIDEDRAAGMTYLFGDWEGLWTPAAEHISQLEAGLPGVLESIGCNDYIQEHLSDYRRQYVGVIIRGERRVLLNAFPGAGSTGSDSHYYWKHQYVFVNDGGHHYWQIQFSTETGEFLEFHQNGYA